jgi:hypothetical protein
MNLRKLLFSFLTLSLVFASCSKEDNLAQNQQNIKKLWKLDNYLMNGVDKTADLIATGYEESYQDNSKYDRSFDRNGNKVTQNGNFSFENATRLKISGVGSVEMTDNNTTSSSYYDIITLNETQFWYSYTNGGVRHEFRLSRKS